VRIDDTGLHRLADSAAVPMHLKPMDWKYVGGESARSFTVGNSGGLEVAVLHRTFSLSDATVRAAGADVVGSNSHRRRRGRTEGIVPLELTESWALVVDSVTFGETGGEVSGDAMPSAIVNGRAVAFIDDRYEWVTRADQLSADIASRAGDALRPVLEREWRKESRRRNQGSEGGSDGEPVFAGVGGAPAASAAGTADPPWVTGPGASAAPAFGEPTAAPWQSPSGDASGGDLPPERPW